MTADLYWLQDAAGGVDATSTEESAVEERCAESLRSELCVQVAGSWMTADACWLQDLAGASEAASEACGAADDSSTQC